MSLVEQLRGIGLAMGSWYSPFEQAVRDEEGHETGETISVRQFVGWTTDQAKATAAEEAGATLREYRSADSDCSGWEVVVREVVS